MQLKWCGNNTRKYKTMSSIVQTNLGMVIILIRSFEGYLSIYFTPEEGCRMDRLISNTKECVHLSEQILEC